MTADLFAAHDRAAAYGVQETNPIGDMHALLDTVDFKAGTFHLSNPELVKIVRLRLIGCSWEYPYWDVSYCYGELADGRVVRVDIGEYRIDRRWARHLVQLAKEAGRYGKGMGLLDAVSTLAG